MPCGPRKSTCCAAALRGTSSLKRLLSAYLAGRKLTPRDDISSYLPKRPIREAIRRAAWAKRDDDKRHSHQRLSPRNSLRDAEAALLRKENVISAARDFGALLNIVEKTVRGIPGLGELYVYDTSLRVGRTLKKSPKTVYLHRGARDGARALDLKYKKAFLTKSELPPALRNQKPEDIEDFLCTCKNALKTLQKRKRKVKHYRAGQS